MSEASYALWAEGIGRSFGRVEALKAASLWAERGKVTTLMGRNGSGKTTLMRIAAGALRPHRGVVCFEGDVRPRHALADLARRGLMYLPQDRLLAPAFRVRDHVQAVAGAFGVCGIDDGVGESGIEPLMDRRVAELSGGERVRASLGLAFVREPTVLLADEPLVGLAPRDQGALGLALRKLAARGTAVATSGHDVRALFDISDVIIWSVAGTTHHLGGPADARAHGQFQREYLGPGLAEAMSPLVPEPRKSQDQRIEGGALGSN